MRALFGRRFGSDRDGRQQQVYCIGFNQDASCVAIGTSKGFAIYNCEPFKRRLVQVMGGIGVLEMLFCTSLVALVGAGDQPSFSPRRLRVWDTDSSACMVERNFVTKILAVKLNRQRLVVCLETSLYIFDLNTMSLLQSLDTSPNPKGLIALSPNEDNSYLVFPGKLEGEIMVNDTINMKILSQAMAHERKLAALAISLDGSMLATASENGTVVRVFNLPTADKLYTLRRGNAHCEIYSLAFNHTATMLALSSSTGTIHVFQLGNEGGPPQASNSGGARAGNGGVDAAGSDVKRKPTGPVIMLGGSPIALGESAQALMSTYLPKRLTDVVDSNRSFAQARLQHAEVPNVCALVPSRGSDGEEGENLVVVTATGFLYHYAVDLLNGGACRLIREDTLLEEDDGDEPGRGRRIGESQGQAQGGP